MMAKLRSVAQLVLLATSSIAAIHGFAPPSTSASTTKNIARQRSQYAPRAASITSLREKKKSKSSERDSAVSNKLLVETVAPFRGLRLFFYAAFASGAFVGGLINASGAVAALSGLRGDEVDMNTEYLNLAIDFGAVAFFAIAAKLDLDKGAELTAAVDESPNQKIALSIEPIE